MIRVRVAWGVAVAGWQWHQSIEEIKAVRMVPDTMCGCGCGGGWVAVEKMLDFWIFLKNNCGRDMIRVRTGRGVAVAGG
jgi:hypothetical protein